MIPKGIYPILDVGPYLEAQRAAEVATAWLDAGAQCFQLRAKSLGAGALLELACTLEALAKPRGARLIVNDRPDVAALSRAYGVHLGQDDLPVDAARTVLHPDQKIGLSCHDLEQVLNAPTCDYLGFGPIFRTRSKTNPDPEVGLEGLAQACAESSQPIVAIGGIGLDDIPKIRAAGAHSAAMISALLNTDDPGAAFATAQARWRRGA